MAKAMPAFLKHQAKEMKGATPAMKKAEKKETAMVKKMTKKAGRGR